MEHNLEVAKVTIHMLIALVIAALAYRIIYESGQIKIIAVNKNLRRLSLVTIILLLVQIILGTEIREQIDQVSLDLKFESREKWISQLDTFFYVHRSFSLVVATFCLFLYFNFRKYAMLKNSLLLSALLVISIIALGVIMNYLSIPALAQPLHLLFSSILIVLIYSIYIKSSSEAI